MSDMQEKETAAVATEDPSSVAAAVERPEYTRRRTFGELLRGDLGFIPVLITLILVVLYFEVTTNGLFLTARNLSFLAQQMAETGIVGLGSIMVLLLGEIDLSVAAVAQLCAVVMAVCSERLGMPAVAAIPVALLAGAIIGLINGILVAVVRVPSFIVTLAGSIAYSGLLLFLMFGQSTLIVRNDFIVAIAGSPLSFFPDYLGVGLPILAVLLYAVGLLYMYTRRRRLGLRTQPLGRVILQIAIVAVLVIAAVAAFESYNGVPYSTALLFGLILLFWVLMTKTRFGRHVYATGGNSEAARRAGINVVGIRIAVFTLCSLLAAVAGVVQASRNTAVYSAVSPVLLLEAIGAAVIGGVSLFGGRGSVWAIVLGVLIIQSLDNGLTLQSQSAAIQEMVEGAVLILAVISDALIRRAQARSHSGR
ncbi:MAG TPA: inner-membrane translocator [Ktedonobacteraceae bacterium]|nr:inner-membrane translocator [Ktedonobacteraceae bacterium]